MNFIICLAVPLKMSKETVPSMLINILTHHPKAPKFCSLMNMTSKSKKMMLSLLDFSIRCIFQLF